MTDLSPERIAELLGVAYPKKEHIREVLNAYEALQADYAADGEAYVAAQTRIAELEQELQRWKNIADVAVGQLNIEQKEIVYQKARSDKAEALNTKFMKALAMYVTDAVRLQIIRRAEAELVERRSYVLGSSSSSAGSSILSGERCSECFQELSNKHLHGCPKAKRS